MKTQQIQDFTGDGSSERLIRGFELWLKSCPVILSRTEQGAMIEVGIRSLREEGHIETEEQAMSVSDKWRRRLGIN